MLICLELQLLYTEQTHITYTSENIWHVPVSRGTGREWQALSHRQWSDIIQLSSFLPHVKVFPFCSNKICPAVQISVLPFPCFSRETERVFSRALLPMAWVLRNTETKRGQRSTGTNQISAAVSSKFKEWIKHVVKEKLCHQLKANY